MNKKEGIFKQGKYCIALDCGQGNWQLESFQGIAEAENFIISGRTGGKPFKVLKELDFELKIKFN